MRQAGFTDLAALVQGVRVALHAPGRLYLVGRTSHLAERWCATVPRFTLAGDGHVKDEVLALATAMDIGVVWESPADIVPLPGCVEERCRPAPPLIRFREGKLEVVHFDPYSVILRLVARGDEPDYIDSVEYITRGWVSFARLEDLVAEVLPRFTNETLAQDPAEFRRKLRGLKQLVGGGPKELRYEPALAEVAWV